VLGVVDIVAGLLAVAVAVLCGRTGVAAGVGGPEAAGMLQYPHGLLDARLLQPTGSVTVTREKPPGASSMLKIAFSAVVTWHSPVVVRIAAPACLIARSKLVVAACVMT